MSVPDYLVEEEVEEIKPKGRLAPEDLPTSYLLSAGYDGDEQKAYLRLYEPVSQQIYLWYDNSNHLPYCISKLPIDELEKNSKIIKHDGYFFMEQVLKYDALKDKNINVTKIVAHDPLSIGGGRGVPIRNLLDNSWESRIRYYQCYLYDRGIITGMPYRIEKGNLIEEGYTLPKETEDKLDVIFQSIEPEFKKGMKEWARLLQCPVPKIRRVAVDIEVRPSVRNRMPSADDATDPITAVGIAGNDSYRRILLLNDMGIDVEAPVILGAKVEVYTDEKKLIQEVFKVLNKFPVILTFNGDDFDFKFLHNRAKNLGIPDSENPIVLGQRFAFLRNGVHLDLYRFFLNRSIQGYAFGNRYRENTLNDISSGLINMKKIEIGDIMDLNINELAQYCMQDADITYQLTAFNHDLVMNLAMLLTRISKMIMEDVTRQGVSRWILALMEYEHRSQGWLIPNTEDILEMKGSVSTTSIIKGKKYQGAIVRDPTPGTHFNVTVCDFASLYPSAIRNWNLSYDTILCPHPECRENKVPGTPHWVCTKKRGMASLIIGSLKDLRVQWYKPLSKDNILTVEERQYYDVVQQALKVFLNASYGVFGSESFPLYCPPLAESTAAVGRYAMSKAIEKSQQLGIEVIYGDTDSVFLENPDENQIENLVKWADSELGIDLDVDKNYRYAIFSSRKKNYLGVYPDGKLDIKGLTGKKRHIPPILKDAFIQLTGILSNVEKPEEFPHAKEQIKRLVSNISNKLKKRDFNISEVAFSMMMGKNVEGYDTNPQHVKAARMLVDQGHEIREGDIISYVVTRDGVKPVQIANIKDVDINKYEEYLEATFEQILDALDMNFDELVGRPRQTGLGAFFKN
ncbi:DNA-directed DNA polymerase I [Candidatus Bathyarchaeota archaeon]|nr:DNA-directed DNA polymerase I [Candidatus Bathyarchaeota archaeon]